MVESSSSKPRPRTQPCVLSTSGIPDGASSVRYTCTRRATAEAYNPGSFCTKTDNSHATQLVEDMYDHHRSN